MAKTVYTERVAGVELERSKVRAGTKCKCCGKSLNGELGRDFFQTKTKSCAVAYVCKDCIKHRSYGNDLHGREIIGGKLTSGNYRFAVEIEANYYDENPSEIHKVDCYLAAQWGLQPSQDCTVGVEYHMTNKVNFHGLKDFMEDISKMVELDASNCGHHINISKIYWTAESMDKIRYYQDEIFSKVMQTMQENNEATKNLFGRYFGNWARNDNYFQHGSWLNLENTYHMEFRLPHFKNANQFFYCANFCRDCTDIIDSWLNGEISLEKTADKINSAFEKYTKGKANCQRAERNKIER